MILSQAALGMGLMALQGVIFSVQLVLGKILQGAQWPYYRIFSLSNFIPGCCLAVSLVVRRVPLPPASLQKWAVLRGLFGNITAFTSTLAVQVGAPLGDVAALTSINIVLTALLGHIFLSERLRWPHIFAIAGSFGGAVLVARPAFLFGGPAGGQEVPWIGYLLAASSGFFQACLLIASRKSATTSVALLSCSTWVQTTVVFGIFPFTGIISDGSLDRLISAPGQAVGWLFALMSATVIAVLTMSAGSRMCPAAVSATLVTSSRMVCGYVAQVVVFGMVPGAVTLCGAALMLASVVVMAYFRVQQGPVELPHEILESKATTISEGDIPETPEVKLDDASETESLVSFIATEFAVASPSLRQARLRRPAPAPEEPSATQLGAAAMGVVVAMA